MVSGKEMAILARHLKEKRPIPPSYQSDNEYRAAIIGWGQAVIATADALRECNPRFNRELFYKACGL